MYKNILIPTDGSELSSHAVKDGLALAKSLGAKVTALTVMAPYLDASLWEIAIYKEPEKYEKHIMSDAQRHIDKVKAAAKEIGIDINSVTAKARHPWKEIIETSEKLTCDLIVMGSHGRSGVTSVLLGSETQKVLANSKIPVLVHR